MRQLIVNAFQSLAIEPTLNMRALVLICLGVFSFGLVACFPSPWQQRADELQGGLVTSVRLGLIRKDDFIRRYGLPAGCLSLGTGELCEWNVALGSISESEYTSAPLRFGGRVYGVGTSGISASANASQVLRAEFNQSGQVVKGQFILRRGGHEFYGRNLLLDDMSSVSAPKASTEPTPALGPVVPSNLGSLRELFGNMNRGAQIRLRLYDESIVEGVFINSGGIDNAILMRPADGSWPKGKVFLLRQIKTAEQLEK
jgi:hypothetical protein